MVWSWWPSDYFSHSWPSGWSFTLAAKWLVIYFGGRVVGHFSWRRGGWSLFLAAGWLITFFGGRVVGHSLMMAEWLSLLASRVLTFFMTAKYLVSRRSWRRHIFEFKSSNSGLGPLYYGLPCRVFGL